MPDHPNLRVIPKVDAFSFPSPRSAQGRLTADGFAIYFYLETDLPGDGHGAWQGRQRQCSGASAAFASDEMPFGVYFETSAPTREVHVRVGFSFRSVEQARTNLRELEGLGFDEAAAQAGEEWQQYLDAIRVETDSDALKARFYSSLYHSLVKPAWCPGESPYWEDEPFFVDFATMWDMYKTQLPLVLALYHEPAGDLVRFLQLAMDAHGGFPNGYVMSDNLLRFEDQASGLGWHTLADAWSRSRDAFSIEALRRQMRAFLEAPRVREFLERGVVHPLSHALDLTVALNALHAMAEDVGDAELVAQLSAQLGNWRNAYDPQTGLLRADSNYYEGTHWNYSFRPHPCMAERVELAGGPDRFAEKLDTFFGFADVASGLVDPEPPAENWQRQMRHDRFEGLNNESDMESPYAYLWAGRHDRTARVVRDAMRWQFSDGAGGLPGNNDSGGLTSWYVWNALGLFPLSGQALYLIGSPLVDEATIDFPTGSLRIVATDNSDANLYVRSATLNGQPLERTWLDISEVEKGGELVLQMDSEPTREGGLTTGPTSAPGSAGR